MAEQQSNKFYTISKITKQSGSTLAAGQQQFILSRGVYSADSFCTMKAQITEDFTSVNGKTYALYTPNVTIDGDLVYNTYNKHFIAQQEYVDNFNRDKFSSLDTDNKQSKFIAKFTATTTTIPTNGLVFNITMNIKDLLPFLFKPNQQEIYISQQMVIQIRFSDVISNKIAYITQEDTKVNSIIDAQINDIYFFMKKYNNVPMNLKQVAQSCYFQYQYAQNSFTFSQNLKDKISKFQLLALTNLDITSANFSKTNSSSFIQSCDIQGIQVINAQDALDSLEILQNNINTQRYSNNMYTLFNQELEDQQIQVQAQASGSQIRLIFGIQYYMQRNIE